MTARYPSLSQEQMIAAIAAAKRIPEAEVAAQIGDAAEFLGRSVPYVTRALYRHHTAAQPATVEHYMAGHPGRFERADCPDPEVRL